MASVQPGDVVGEVGRVGGRGRFRFRRPGPKQMVLMLARCSKIVCSDGW
jgi:hypothetical protein